MAKRKNLFKFDTEKFKKIVKSKGYTLYKLSQDIGYSSSYLGNRVNFGEMPVTAAIVLENMYGIKREDYELKETPKFNPLDEADDGYICLDKKAFNSALANIITQAVYEGVKQALKEI